MTSKLPLPVTLMAIAIASAVMPLQAQITEVARAPITEMAQLTFGHRCDDRFVIRNDGNKPVDLEYGLIRLDRADGTPLAVLFNYACHPVVLGPDNYEYSADYVGTACATVEEQLKIKCLFLQGDVTQRPDLGRTLRRGQTHAAPLQNTPVAQLQPVDMDVTLGQDVGNSPLLQRRVDKQLVGGLHHIGSGQWPGRFARHVPHVEETRVDKQQPALRIIRFVGEHAITRAVKRAPQVLQALRQCRLGPHLLGDVARHGDHTQQVPGEHAIIGLRPTGDLAAPFDLSQAGDVRWSSIPRPRASCPTCSPG